MKLRLCTLLLLLVISSLYGQQSKIDSLTKILESETVDTIRLKTYHELIKFYSNNDISLAEKYLDTMLNLSKIKSLKKYELAAASQKGILLYRQGKFEDGLNYWKKSLKLEGVDNYPIQKGNLLNNIAVGYKVLKNNDSVLFYMNKSIKLNEYLNNNEALIANYYSISDFYNRIDSTNLSIKYLNKLKLIALKLNNQLALGRMYILLGSISRKENDFDDSISHFQNALSIYNELQPDNTIMNRGLKYEIANTNLRGSRYLETISILNSIKEEFNNLDDKDFWISVDISLLTCYINTDNRILAEDIYKKLILLDGVDNLEFNRTKDVLFKIVLSEYELAYKKASKKTINRLKQGLKIAESINDIDLLYQLHKSISQYQFIVEDFRKAYVSLQISNQFLDSLNNIEVMRVNLALKRKFNEELNEKKILTQSLEIEKKEKQKLQLIFILSIISLLSFWLGYLAYIRQRRLKKEQFRYEKEVAKVKQLEQAFEEKVLKISYKDKIQEFHEFLKNKFKLTDTIFEYWKLQANGYSETEMQKKLHLSKEAIKSRRTRLYEKIKVHENIDQSIRLSKSDSVRIYRENQLEFM